jgi:hypothetical protein
MLPPALIKVLVRDTALIEQNGLRTISAEQTIFFNTTAKGF